MPAPDDPQPPPGSPMPPPRLDPRTEARLQRLEEAAGFADHAMDELNQSVLDLARRLDQALARLDALERRLGSIEDAAAESPEASDADPEP